MSGGLSIFLSILIFIFSLGLLIVIHELGHFSMAKLFKVYVYEFSVGMGPKLIKKKRKNGETYFALRAIPFGGFVSMFDEGEDSLEYLGYELPKERSMSGIKKWKRIIILLAGVTLNFILGYVLFFIDNAAFEQRGYYIQVGETVADSPVSGKIGNLDLINFTYYHDHDQKYLVNSEGKRYSNYYTIDPEAQLIRSGESDPLALYVVFDNEDNDVLNKDDSKRDYANWFVFFYGLENEDGTYRPDLENNFIFQENDEVQLKLQMYQGRTSDPNEFDPTQAYKYTDKLDENGDPIPAVVTVKFPDFESVVVEDIEIDLGYNVQTTVNYQSDTITLKTKLVENKDEAYYEVENLGFHTFIHRYRHNFGEAFYYAGKDWVDSTGTIFKTVGQLFTFNKEVWSSIGGPVAIFFQTEQIFRAADIGLLFQFWGMISVNLAIVNLLPIPGLDGFQVIVIIIEAIIRRELPKKVKQIMSIVGMVLLFTLMGVVVVMDILRSCGVLTSLMFLRI